MEISLKESDFLESFDLLWSKDLDKYKKNKLNLFVLKINSNEFDYDLLIDMLLDPVIDYSISRQVKERYKNRPATLSKKAREKFVEYARNNGELGELLLFCFRNTLRSTQNSYKIGIENLYEPLCKWCGWSTLFKTTRRELPINIR